MSYVMDSGRLSEVLKEYEDCWDWIASQGVYSSTLAGSRYNHDIKLGEVYGTMLLGEFIWMLGRIAELESENNQLRGFRDAIREISESGTMHSGEAMNLQDIASEALEKGNGQ